MLSNQGFFDTISFMQKVRPQASYCVFRKDYSLLSPSEKRSFYVCYTEGLCLGQITFIWPSCWGRPSLDEQQEQLQQAAYIFEKDVLPGSYNESLYIDYDFFAIQPAQFTSEKWDVCSKGRDDLDFLNGFVNLSGQDKRGFPYGCFSKERFSEIAAVGCFSKERFSDI